jgi:osmotically-inducible protein OsmY
MAKQSNHKLSWLAGMGIGAALMYFLDPKRGARRRHMVKDQAASAARSGRARLRKVAENTKNHALGAVHEVEGRIAKLTKGEALPDYVLVARVRAALGHRMRNAGAIDVAVRDSAVTLRGPVDADEVEEVLRTAAKVRGVRRVENQLEVAGAAANA